LDLNTKNNHLNDFGNGFNHGLETVVVCIRH